MVQHSVDNRRCSLATPRFGTRPGACRRVTANQLFRIDIYCKHKQFGPMIAYMSEENQVSSGGDLLKLEIVYGIQDRNPKQRCQVR